MDELLSIITMTSSNYKLKKNVQFYHCLFVCLVSSLRTPLPCSAILYTVMYMSPTPGPTLAADKQPLAYMLAGSGGVCQ